MEDETINAEGLSIKMVPSDNLIEVKLTKKSWKEAYTLKARICIRIVNFLLPGFLKLTFINEETE